MSGSTTTISQVIDLQDGDILVIRRPVQVGNVTVYEDIPVDATTAVEQFMGLILDKAPTTDGTDSAYWIDPTTKQVRITSSSSHHPAPLQGQGRQHQVGNPASLKAAAPSNEVVNGGIVMASGAQGEGLTLNTQTPNGTGVVMLNSGYTAPDGYGVNGAVLTKNS